MISHCILRVRVWYIKFFKPLKFKIIKLFHQTFRYWILFLKFDKSPHFYLHFIFSAFKDSLLRGRNVCESGRVPPKVVSDTMSQLGKANTTPLISLQFSSQTCKYTHGAIVY